MAPAASTPGRARTRSSSCGKKIRRRPGAASAVPAIGTVMVRTWRGSNPGSTRRRATKLRTMQPGADQQHQREGELARRRGGCGRPFRSPPAAPRPPSRSAWPTPGAEAWSAGTSPNTRPVASDTARVTAAPARRGDAVEPGEIGGADGEQRRDPRARRGPRRPRRRPAPASTRSRSGAGGRAGRDRRRAPPAPRSPAARRGCPGEQQVGDVGAGDQQHERPPPRAAPAGPAERRRPPCRCSGATVTSRLVPGYSRSSRAVIAAISSPGLGEGGARREPGEDPQAVAAPAGRPVGQGERRPQLGAGGPEGGEAEALRHHPDDRVGVAVEDERAAHHRRIGAEAPPPEPVGEDHDVVAVGGILPGQEDAAELRRHAEESGRCRRSSAGPTPSPSRRRRSGSEPSTRPPTSPRSGGSPGASRGSSRAPPGRCRREGRRRDGRDRGRGGGAAGRRRPTARIAVLAPMPSARASTAAAVKPGVRARVRRP